jgi:hypothetical protein
VPRIFFQGQASWNPATMNNNDQWPTYDFVNASLDWTFLESQTPPITRLNAEQVFPTWAQTPQYYQADPPPGWYQPPSEWNYFGGNEAALHSSSAQTCVTGGQSGYGPPIVTDDALVGAIVGIVGDPFPGTTFPTPARLIDSNPDAFWSTSFFLRSLLVGNQAGPGAYLSGDVAEQTQMSSRWMFLQRNLNIDNQLEIAGVGSCVLQACLPAAGLTINPSGSALLQQLQEALSADGINGVMVRMSIYMTQYFTGSEFDGCKSMSDQYGVLVGLWADDLANGRAPYQNPAVSRVVGSIGLWMDGELASAPGGRYLTPVANVPLVDPPSGAPSSTPFGPAVVEANPEARFVTLDLGSTIPELDSSGQKADFGTLSLVLTGGGGEPTTLGLLTPADYGQAPYEASAGIVDLPLPDGVSASDLAEGTISLEAISGSPVTTALAESQLTVQTDARGIWVDQAQTATFEIQVLQNGAPPTQDVQVLLQQYLPSPPPPQANASSWVIPSEQQPPAIQFLDAPENVVTVPASSGGVASVQFQPLLPGFPVIVFFPFFGGQPPTPPNGIPPVFVPGGPPISITSAFYGTVRVMPFDDDLPLAFSDLWNSTHDRQQAWDFVYGKILSLYSLLFPVMKYYGSLDLGNQDAVDQNIDLILQLTDASMLESSVYMPATRDLSAGKRMVLQMYGALVAKNWADDALGAFAAGGAR